jgi:hypothetical protein
LSLISTGAASIGHNNTMRHIHSHELSYGKSQQSVELAKDQIPATTETESNSLEIMEKSNQSSLLRGRQKDITTTARQMGFKTPQSSPMGKHC